MTRSTLDAALPPGPSAAVAGSIVGSVGVVGLGRMGHVFAVNLLDDGYQVSVNDRDPERIRTLQPKGAVAAQRLGDLAGCDVVLTSLPDDDALAAVALGPEGLTTVLSPNAVHISASTVSPAGSPRSMPAAANSMSPRR
jgi:3-hydroxyisobutyrate dehydrogenase-like beta-hydroxyacid dehydrogenase